MKDRGESTGAPAGEPFSNIGRWIVFGVVLIIAVFFLSQVTSIIYPFVWAILVAYLLTPVVNFINYRLAVPRVIVVVFLYLMFLFIVVAASRFLIPWLTHQTHYFILDLPKLEGSLVHRVGTHPLGINVPQLIHQIQHRLETQTGKPSNAEKLLRGALSVTIRTLIFLFSTFYLLMDGPRIRSALSRVVPRAYRDDVARLSATIHQTWTQYIRGELILFGLMSTVSVIGLEALRVPGAVPLGLATGVLEMLPVVGPFTAGALAVSVAYLSPQSPFGWTPEFYGLAVALMYLAFREIEDYVVIPRVLGRAVRLHPLVILFSLSCGAILFGVLGLLTAVPVAASLKIVGAYLYDKVVKQEPEFADVHGAMDS